MSTAEPHGADPAAVAHRIAALSADGRRTMIALDHDGTLSPIAPRPDEAVLEHGAREALTALTALDDVVDVVIVSGRGLADLSTRFEGLGVELVAEHGLRHRDRSGRVAMLAPELAPATLAWLRGQLRVALPPEAVDGGWIVEDKGVSIAVHHRRVAEGAREPTLTAVRTLLEEAAGQPPGGTVQHGKAVLELRPTGAEKGSALRALMAGRGCGALAMVGDDVTDESALAEAERSGGVGVLVAHTPRASAASMCLADPREVVEMLEHLAAALRRGRSGAGGTASTS